MQRALSNGEYSLLLKEAQALVNCRLDKAYEVAPKKLRLDFGKTSLIVYVGKYFYLTKNPPATPQNPSSFAMFLRKHVGGKFLESFTQHENDRLYIMKFSNGLLLVLEQFAQGNAFVIDEKMNILLPYSYAPTSAKKYNIGQKFEWPVQKNPEWKEKFSNETLSVPEGYFTYSEFVEKSSTEEEKPKPAGENPKLKKLKARLVGQEKALEKLDLEINENAEIANWMEKNIHMLEHKIEDGRKKREKLIKIKKE